MLFFEDELVMGNRRFTQKTDGPHEVEATLNVTLPVCAVKKNKYFVVIRVDQTLRNATGST